MTQFWGAVIAGTVVLIGLGYYVLREMSLMEFFFQRLALQPYDDNRFAAHARALEVALDHPFGIGPGHFVGRRNFPESDFPLATHNVFLKVLVENGWAGLLAFGAMFGYILKRGVALLRIDDGRRPIRIAIISAIIGQLANSYFVDSLHWRHLFVLLGLALCELTIADRPARRRL